MKAGTKRILRRVFLPLTIYDGLKQLNALQNVNRKMMKIFYKYKLTILSATFFITSIIVDYSSYQNNFTWTGTILYKVYSTFGALPIHALYLLITIIFYSSERHDNEKNKKTSNNGLKFFGYLLLLLFIIYNAMSNM